MLRMIQLGFCDGFILQFESAAEFHITLNLHLCQRNDEHTWKGPLVARHEDNI